jgi:hypothetical protein
MGLRCAAPMLAQYSLVLVTAALALGTARPRLWSKNATAPTRRLVPSATSGPSRSSTESGITRGGGRKTGFGRRRGTRPIGTSRGGGGPVSRGVAGKSSMGDATSGPVRLAFNPQLRVEFRGATVTSDAGLLLPRELDERLGLSALIERRSSGSRRARKPPTGLGSPATGCGPTRCGYSSGSSRTTSAISYAGWSCRSPSSAGP